MSHLVHQIANKPLRLLMVHVQLQQVELEPVGVWVFHGKSGRSQVVQNSPKWLIPVEGNFVATEFGPTHFGVQLLAFPFAFCA